MTTKKESDTVSFEIQDGLEGAFLDAIEDIQSIATQISALNEQKKVAVTKALKLLNIEGKEGSRSQLWHGYKLKVSKEVVRKIDQEAILMTFKKHPAKVDSLMEIFPQEYKLNLKNYKAAVKFNPQLAKTIALCVTEGDPQTKLSAEKAEDNEA